jgi:hypothetical protein
MLFTHIWTSPPAVAGLVTIHTTIRIPMNQPRIFPIKRPPPGRAAKAQNKAASCLPAGIQILMPRSADSGATALTHETTPRSLGTGGPIYAQIVYFSGPGSFFTNAEFAVAPDPQQPPPTAERSPSAPAAPGGHISPVPQVNTLPHVGVLSYDEFAAARNVLWIRKEARDVHLSSDASRAGSLASPETHCGHPQDQLILRVPSIYHPSAQV